jgi:hypothetical protein
MKETPGVATGRHPRTALRIVDFPPRMTRLSARCHTRMLCKAFADRVSWASAFHLGLRPTSCTAVQGVQPEARKRAGRPPRPPGRCSAVSGYGAAERQRVRRGCSRRAADVHRNRSTAHLPLVRRCGRTTPAAANRCMSRTYPRGSPTPCRCGTAVRTTGRGVAINLAVVRRTRSRGHPKTAQDRLPKRTSCSQMPFPPRAVSHPRASSEPRPSALLAARQVPSAHFFHAARVQHCRDHRRLPQKPNPNVAQEVAQGRPGQNRGGCGCSSVRLGRRRDRAESRCDRRTSTSAAEQGARDPFRSMNDPRCATCQRSFEVRDPYRPE